VSTRCGSPSLAHSVSSFNPVNGDKLSPFFETNTQVRYKTLLSSVSTDYRRCFQSQTAANPHGYWRWANTVTTIIYIYLLNIYIYTSLYEYALSVFQTLCLCVFGVSSSPKHMILVTALYQTRTDIGLAAVWKRDFLQ
jgi:hypothetical protein